MPGGTQDRNPIPASAREAPPDRLPVYRLITGPDDESFCRRVSDLIELGYLLHGSPALTFDGAGVVAAQALLWPGASHR